MSPAGLLRKLVIPALLAAASIVLGVLGFHRFFTQTGAPGRGEPWLWVEAFHHAAGLPILQTTAIAEPARSLPVELEAARLLGLAAFIYTVATAFLLVFWKTIRPTWWMWLQRSGLSRHAGHAVICGLGWKGRELAADLRRQKYRVIAIERDEENGFLPWCEANGVHVIHGDASDDATLKAARTASAERVYAACYQDDTNLRILHAAARLARARRSRRRIQLAAHFNAETTLALAAPAVRPTDSLGSGVDRVAASGFVTELTTARLFFVRHPLDRVRTPGAAPAPMRLAILGDTAMARAFVVQALRLAVFNPVAEFDIHVFAPASDATLAGFLRDYPCYRKADATGAVHPAQPALEALATVHFHQWPPEGGMLTDDSPLMQSILPKGRMHIVSALDDGPASAYVLSELAHKIGRLAVDRNTAVSAFYYFNTPDPRYRIAMQEALDASHPGLSVGAFGDFLDGCTTAAVEGRPFDNLARLLNFHYAAPQSYAALSGRKALVAAEDVWNASGEQDRMFSRNAADHLPVKLRWLGFDPTAASADFPGLLAELQAAIDNNAESLGRLEHRRWCADHLLAGFRMGQPKIKAEKQHPCLVPWEELPSVADDRTARDPEFYRMQAMRMASVIPKLYSDLWENAKRG